MHPSIAAHRDSLTSICRRYRIRRLDVFGSAARGVDFEPARSDVDFLVEFEPDAPPDLATLFDAKDAFEAVLGSSVDLVEMRAVHNPYVLASINRHRESVYAA